MLRLSSSPARYGVALIATALASLLYFLSGPAEIDSDVHYFGFVLAVLASALAGGLGPGLLATGLSALASAYLLLPPIYSVEVGSHDQLQRLVLFGGEGILLSCVGHIFRDADAADSGATWTWRYLPALLFVFTATGLKLLAFKDVERALPFTFFYVAIAASAWSGGFGPGLAATLLSSLTATWLFLIPQGTTSLLAPTNAARILFFVLEGTLITGLGATYPRARRLAGRAIDQMRRYSERMHRSIDDIRALRLTSRDQIWEWDTVSNRVTVGATATERPETPTVTTTLSNWLQQIHPEDRLTVASSLHSLLTESREDWMCEYRKLRPGLESAHVSDHAYVVRDEEGRPIRVIGRTVDLTESKRVAVASGAQRRFSAVFEENPLAILIIDDALHVSSSNRAASQMLGYSSLELKGMHIEKFFVPTRRTPITRMLLALENKKRASIAFQENCMRVGGELFEAKVNAAVLADVDRGLNELVIMIEEIET